MTTLTKANAGSIIFKLDKPTNYYKYEMVFLKKSILYSFEEPVKMKQCLYDLLISNIGENDLNTLNELFARINSNMKIEKSTFVKLNEQVTIDKGLLTVEIYGFKRLEDLVRPLWKVKSITN